MNVGVLLSVLSLFAMSIAPILNKLASAQIHFAWAAGLSSAFCFLICLLAQPRAALELFRSRALFSKTVFWIAMTNSIGLLCQYGAVVRLDPATLSILGRMYVVFAVILAHVHLKEKSTRLEKATLGAVFFGAVLFCWRSDLQMDMWGVILCLCYCFFFALTHLQVKQASQSISSNSILLANNLVSAMVLIPLALYFVGSIKVQSLQPISMIFGAAFFGQWLGLLLFYESLQRIPMVQANLIRTFSPIIGVIVAWPFFPVTFSSTQVFGAALMVSALIFQSAVKARIPEKKSFAKSA